MWRVKVIAVGRMKEPYFVTAAEEYICRLTPFSRVEVVEVRDEPLPPPDSPGTEAWEKSAREREADRVRKAIATSPGAYVVALEPGGRAFRSEELAHFIASLASERQKSSLLFIIGGASGLDPSISAAADLRLSLGPLTFPHQLARVILLEQLYRAFTIINNVPYHR